MGVPRDQSCNICRELHFHRLYMIVQRKFGGRKGEILSNDQICVTLRLNRPSAVPVLTYIDALIPVQAQQNYQGLREYRGDRGRVRYKL